MGIGATVPKNGDVKREELSSNDKLRRQLLGKDYEKKLGKRKREEERSKSRPLQAGSKPRPASSKQRVDEDSEDEPGRSALGKPRRGHAKNATAQPNGEAREDAVLKSNMSTDAASMEHGNAHKRTSNYLDEVLEDRSRRRHKKSKKKKRESSEEKAASPSI